MKHRRFCRLLGIALLKRAIEAKQAGETIAEGLQQLSRKIFLSAACL